MKKLLFTFLIAVINLQVNSVFAEVSNRVPKFVVTTKHNLIELFDRYEQGEDVSATVPGLIEVSYEEKQFANGFSQLNGALGGQNSYTLPVWSYVLQSNEGLTCLIAISIADVPPETTKGGSLEATGSINVARNARGNPLGTEYNALLRGFSDGDGKPGPFHDFGARNEILCKKEGEAMTEPEMKKLLSGFFEISESPSYLERNLNGWKGFFLGVGRILKSEIID